MTETVSGNILTAEESDIKDQPHIKGSRITVNFIQSRVEGRGLKPETVAERHNLTLADVYAALTYYHNNPREMWEIQERREEISEEVREQSELTPPDDDES
ncbi:hypothetical protein BRD17_04600 [Halobacteriales archaeon SW_7_68_16]|nr:MAG: hypothetical protein BRD17_04600 [Halobacteriales archaeon SW_7_68_16]